MFPTTARGRRAHARETQRETRPDPNESGADSFYGVRSLNGSVWSDTPQGGDQAAVVVATTDLDRSNDTGEEASPNPDQGAEEEEDKRDPDASPTSTITSSSARQHQQADTTPIAERRLLLSPLLPASPSPQLAEFDHYDPTSPPLTADTSPPPSEPPSSPASFTSLPSYVSSMMSRTSSPMGYLSDAYSSHQERGGGGAAAAAAGEHELVASEELVLPTLSLPSSSLHLSLRRWEGSVEGVRAVLIGSEAEKRRFVRALEGALEREEKGRELVEVGKGEVGVLERSEGRVRGRVVVGCSAEQTKATLTEGYKMLDSLLNPSVEGGVEALVKAYVSETSEWVHLVYALDADEPQVEAFTRILPVASGTSESPNLFRLSSASRTASPAAAPLPDQTPMPDPTPVMADLQCDDRAVEATASSYFSRPMTSPTLPSDQASHLLSILASPEALLKASTSSFLSWRKSRPSPTRRSTMLPPVSAKQSQPSSMTSTAASLPSTSDNQAPMPTVARATGGGEWEATLSRRLATRKRATGTRGRPRRRSSRDRDNTNNNSKECVPLFPKGLPGAVSHVGLWGWMRQWLGRGMGTGKGELPQQEREGQCGEVSHGTRRGLRRWAMVLGVGVVVAGMGWWISSSRR